MPVADDILSVLTHIGSLPVTLTAVLLTAGWAIYTRSATREGLALIAGYAVTFAAVHIGKAATDRPRPSDPHASAERMAYPSGHSAYAVALVACAVVLARGGHNLATRFALVTIAIALAAAVGRLPRLPARALPLRRDRRARARHGDLLARGHRRARRRRASSTMEGR